MRRRRLLALLPAALAALPLGTRAAAAKDDKPFARHRLALQLSDRDPSKRAMILSVANKMLQVYGPDGIAVEVVAFGPGIDLLRAESPEREGVDSLISQGVVFDVCMNTVDTLERETGKPVALNRRAKPVAAGAARLLDLAERGYTIIRP